MKAANLKRSILLVIKSWDGMPMPQRSVITAAQAHAGQPRPTDSDMSDALRACETEGYITGTVDEFSGEQVWLLTAKGIIKAQQLS